MFIEFKIKFKVIKLNVITSDNKIPYSYLNDIANSLQSIESLKRLEFEMK